MTAPAPNPKDTPMTLDQKIRASFGTYRPGAGALQAVVIAVLDKHQPRPIDGHKPDGPQYCPNCVGHFEEFADYPCPTVAALASALGIDLAAVTG